MGLWKIVHRKARGKMSLKILYKFILIHLKDRMMGGGRVRDDLHPLIHSLNTHIQPELGQAEAMSQEFTQVPSTDGRSSSV